MLEEKLRIVEVRDRALMSSLPKRRASALAG